MNMIWGRAITRLVQMPTKWTSLMSIESLPCSMLLTLVFTMMNIMNFQV